MVIQIYGAKLEEDVRALVEMGLDHIGLAVRPHEDEKTAKLVEIARGRSVVVLLPLVDSAEEMVEAVRRHRPDVVHISNNVEMLGLDQIAAFRDAVFPVKVMKAIPVAPPAYSHTVDSLALARAFDPFVDFLLLDTKLGDDNGDPMPGWIGVTGKTHDWRISRAIVEQCRARVILAGGLKPHNVAAAIEAVRPWGVDSCTGTDLYPDKKDLEACRAFIENARAASQDLSPTGAG